MDANPDLEAANAGPQPIDDEALEAATGGTGVTLCSSAASCNPQSYSSNSTINMTVTTTHNDGTVQI